ncbi:MAG: S1 family peptidase [Acidimicrobiales bacterium]
MQNPFRVRRFAALATAALMVLGLWASPAHAAPNQPGPEPDIIGGTPVPDGRYPFQSALLNENAGGSDYDKQFCGGTLIAPRWVLTAAHCVDGASPGALAVTVGRTVLSSTQGERFDVRSIRVHPKFETASWISHDAALLRIDGTSLIEPIRVLAIGENGLEAPGTNLTTSGWGTTCFPGGCFPDRLHEVDVPVVGDGPCRSAYGADLHKPTSVCAGAEGIDSCSGDSGGPLFATEPGGFVQVGIVSWGNGCALADFPGVYSEVNHNGIRNWIQRVAGV